MASDADKIMKDLMSKNTILVTEKGDLNGQIKMLMKKITDLEEEVEDSIASAEAANMGKSAVEKDWMERLVKVLSECLKCAVVNAVQPMLQHTTA
jgi:hypothetical protein